MTTIREQHRWIVVADAIEYRVGQNLIHRDRDEFGRPAGTYPYLWIKNPRAIAGVPASDLIQQNVLRGFGMSRDEYFMWLKPEITVDQFVFQHHA